MKLYLIIIFCLNLLACSIANINFIDVSKITSDNKLVSKFDIIKENQNYYNQWMSNWPFEKSKQDFINNLRNDYTAFSSISNPNSELFLLLGDISHYLYNLEDSTYFNKAVNNYNYAIREKPTDFRNYWFLGRHYALSNNPNLSIENFLNAKHINQDEKPAEFWNDLAYSAYASNMPTTCKFALDKSKIITGFASTFEKEFGEINRKRIQEIDKNINFKKEEIWEFKKDKKILFTSRPLGVKVSIDPNWGINITDYNKNQGAFIIFPPALLSDKGKKIEYTIALMFKTADESDNLNNNLAKYISKYKNKNKVALPDKYDKMQAYEIFDKSMYVEVGGGHLYVVGIERNSPDYPGLLLETPYELPQNSDVNKPSFYKAKENKDRFKGKVFYTIILDTCEDIFEKSSEIFKKIFDEQIIIE